MKPSEIIKDIENLTTEWGTLIQRETSSLTTLVSEQLNKLINISNKYRKSIEESKLEWKTIKEEVGKLEERKGLLKEREDAADKKTEELKEQEENLASLHKVLENKRKMIEAKEVELQLKKRRSI